MSLLRFGSWEIGKWFWYRGLWGILAAIGEQGDCVSCWVVVGCVFMVLVFCSICRLPSGTQQPEQPLGFAAPAAENRWLSYLPAVVPRYQ